MRIMLVNDDGCHADGIQTLARILNDAGHETIICAPSENRSGASHSFSFGRKVKAEPFAENGVSGYAISGSPADCAALGLHLLANKVDFVVSGINHGTNLGGACIYSGTVGGAMEASMIGVPAAAVSIGDYNDGYCFADAAKVFVKMLGWITGHPLGRGEVYNINIPNLPYEQVKGFKSATLTKNLRCNSSYIKTEEPDGSVSYLTHFGGFIDSDDMECDHMLLKDGWVTVTPLTWDITAGRSICAPDIEL